MEIKLCEGMLSQVAMIRMPPGTDIIEGIEEVCRRAEIKTGAIISCIGSLQKTSIMIAVPRKNKIGAGYSDPQKFDGPLELLSAQGTIGLEESGERFIHLHALMSDKDGNVHGGHMIKGESPVLITCEIMISKIQGARMIRSYDPEVEMKVLLPYLGQSYEM